MIAKFPLTAAHRTPILIHSPCGNIKGGVFLTKLLSLPVPDRGNPA
nr:MAG TPA: hypothetical protein [Caudoviricetes sp.]